MRPGGPHRVNSPSRKPARNRFSRISVQWEMRRFGECVFQIYAFPIVRKSLAVAKAKVDPSRFPPRRAPLTSRGTPAHQLSAPGAPFVSRGAPSREFSVPGATLASRWAPSRQLSFPGALFASRGAPSRQLSVPGAPVASRWTQGAPPRRKVAGVDLCFFARPGFPYRGKSLELRNVLPNPRLFPRYGNPP